MVVILILLSTWCCLRWDLLFFECTGHGARPAMPNAFPLDIFPFLKSPMCSVDLSNTFDLEELVAFLGLFANGVALGKGQSRMSFSLTYMQQETIIPKIGMTLMPKPTAPSIIRWSLMWLAIGLIHPWKNEKWYWIYIGVFCWNTSVFLSYCIVNVRWVISDAAPGSHRFATWVRN